MSISSGTQIEDNYFCIRVGMYAAPASRGLRVCTKSEGGKEAPIGRYLHPRGGKCQNCGRGGAEGGVSRVIAVSRDEN